jgi:hypothetical protein
MTTMSHAPFNSAAPRKQIPFRSFRSSAFCFLLTFLLAGFSIAAENPSFPLRVSANHRHLVDQKDRPFFYHADTAWMLFLKLTAPEAAEYLAARKAQGFSVIQVQLTGFLGATTRADELPFAPPTYDFAEPNEAFFAHVDKVVAEAERQGLVLAITPAWSGCCAEGWAGQMKDKQPAPLNTNGPEKARALGKWIGTRYAKFSNVMWIMGGDNDPDNARGAIRQLALGIKEAAPAQLMTYHAASTHSSTDVWPADESWLEVSMVYTYFRGFNKAWKREQPDVYEVSHAEFAKSPTRPFFLGESTYEGEHGDWGSALQARKQAYWCVLGGGCGHAYGSPNWNFPENWREVLKLPGAASLKHLRTLLEAREWWTLVPDVKNEVVVTGHGESQRNNLATAARTVDGRSLLAYLPGPRTLTVDLAKMTGTPLVASWFNPRTGESTKIGEFTEKQRTEFNPRGEGDWVLVIETATTP